MKFQPTSRPYWMALWILLVATVSLAKKVAKKEENYFKRVSTFLPCSQIDQTCDTDDETNAETVWYFTKDDSIYLVYTDSERKVLGFVDITDPIYPRADGTVALEGEPTTVRVIGDYGTYRIYSYILLYSKLSLGLPLSRINAIFSHCRGQHLPKLRRSLRLPYGCEFDR
jgi:hypothetical protein